MRVTIAAVGRMKAGPERALLERYLDRTGKAGRAIGLGPVDMSEIAEGRGETAELRRSAEAAALAPVVADVDRLIALDERGSSLSSTDFAGRIGAWRDAGSRRLGIVIGGAEGLDPVLRDRADLVLAFGAMTWPHQLARLMLAEQLYRAATILAGHPYHREG